MNWRILNIEYRESDGYIKTVYGVLEHKQMIGENEHFARKIYIKDFNGEIDENFIPLDKINEQTVIEWIQIDLDVELEEKQLQQQFDLEVKKHNEAETKKGLPQHWIQNRS